MPTAKHMHSTKCSGWSSEPARDRYDKRFRKRRSPVRRKLGGGGRDTFGRRLRACHLSGNRGAAAASFHADFKARWIRQRVGTRVVYGSAHGTHCRERPGGGV